MVDVSDYLADVVLAIKEDPKLVNSFNEVLQIGGSSKQVQVEQLLQKLEKQDAPKEVLTFVKLLKDEQLAQQILNAINN
ncbi:MAG: hypothetical protein HOO06_06970 [Bdellovibrionaceae bacterium]|jgi:hypothetical protein|nr:hypothetical protein [Pseudobdellovibrionaceae bacterium]